MGTLVFSYGGLLFTRFVRRDTSLFLTPFLIAILAVRGRAPWLYQRFCRESADMLLLKRSAERFEFTHRLLRDHFALREFEQILHGAQYDVLAAAIERLAHLGESSLDTLSELARHSEPSVRRAAVAGLGSLRMPRVATLLARILSTEMEPSVRAEAKEMLSRLPRQEVFDTFMLVFEEEDETEKLAVLAALSPWVDNGDILAMGLLKKAMADPSPQVSQAASKAWEDME